MFELLVPAEKAQLDQVKGDKKAYDLEIRPGLMVQAIRNCRMRGSSRTCGRSKGSTAARIARRSCAAHARRPRQGRLHHSGSR